MRPRIIRGNEFFTCFLELTASVVQVDLHALMAERILDNDVRRAIPINIDRRNGKFRLRAGELNACVSPSRNVELNSEISLSV